MKDEIIFSYLVRRGNFNLLDSRDVEANIHLAVIKNGEKTFCNLSLDEQEYDYLNSLFNDSPLEATIETFKTYEKNHWIIGTRTKSEILAFKKAFRENYDALEKYVITQKITQLEQRIEKLNKELEQTKRHLSYFNDDITSDCDLPFPEVVTVGTKEG